MIVLVVAAALCVCVRADAANGGPLKAVGGVSLRWRSGDTSVVQLTGHVEFHRGSNRLEADRAVIWIDETASAKAGKVVMEVYAEGHVQTIEAGASVNSPRTFLRLTADEFSYDDVDGFLETVAAPPKTAFLARAEAVRKAGAVPVVVKPIPPKKKPPVAQLEIRPPDTGIVEPTRIGHIYGQQQEGPDIKYYRDGDYQVIIATRYPDIIFLDPGSDVGRIEILAENMIIWVNRKKLSEGRRLLDADLEIYAEGHVVVYHGDKIIKCEQLFYDYRNQRSLILGGPRGTAVIRTKVKNLTLPLYHRAKEFRQVSAGRYTGKDVIISTCEFNPPEWGIRCSEVDVVINSQLPDEGLDDLEEGGPTGKVTGTHARLELGGIPVFYWPWMSRQLGGHKALLKNLRIRNSNQFGFSVLTEWDLYALGLYDNDWSDLTLFVDYYSERGEGFGLAYTYELPGYFGDFFGYTINDTGTDKTGMTGYGHPRSRVKWRHRHTLSDHWRADAEVSWITDSQYLDEYWEQELKEEKEQETLLYLRYLEENRSFSLLGNFRINGFQTQNEQLPEARFVWTGEPLWGGRLTYIQDSRFGNIRRRWNDEMHALGLLPSDYRSLRGITEHEVQYPFRLGPVKLAPFFNATYSFYDQVISGDHHRFALTAGVRSSMQVWRIYDVHSRLWDINRLRHVITPTIDIFDTFEMTKQPSAIYQFDDLDMVSDTKVIRLGLRQRLQTRRRARAIEPAQVGGWYTVDWMLLDLELDYYPQYDRHNMGRSLSPFRMKYHLQLSDRIWLYNETDLRVDTGPYLETFSTGIGFDRSPKMSLYLGQHYTNVSGSNTLVGKLDYVVDKRWQIGLLGQFDSGTGDASELRLILRRKYHRWMLDVGVEYDAGENDTKFMLMIIPEGLRDDRLSFF